MEHDAAKAAATNILLLILLPVWAPLLFGVGAGLIKVAFLIRERIRRPKMEPVQEPEGDQ